MKIRYQGIENFSWTKESAKKEILKFLLDDYTSTDYEAENNHKLLNPQLVEEKNKKDNTRKFGRKTYTDILDSRMQDWVSRAQNHGIDLATQSFDLDPASPEGGVPWLPTNKYFTKKDNGLEQEWVGNVWLNPPYGRHTGTWLDKFINHGNGIALVFARTETLWFHNYALQSDGLLFTKGRFKFAQNGVQKDYASIGSLFIACGQSNCEALKNSGMGWYVEL